MNKLLLITLTFLITCQVYGQANPTELAQPIVEEGKMLYKSEMASWHGTDLFLEKYKNLERVKGYFSYSEALVTKCIFFSRDSIPVVLGTIEFDTTFQVSTAKVNIEERAFSTKEKELHIIREKAMVEIQTDTLFKTYSNTNLNLIPIINENKKKVYILTGPQEEGVVIIGNDYLILFDEENEVISKKKLHKNIIPIYYGEEKEGAEAIGAMHSHLPETGEFITATDICTLMMYSKYAKWKTHNVVSTKYLNIWNCETNNLVVLPMDVVKKINKDQEKRGKKKKKKNKKRKRKADAK